MASLRSMCAVAALAALVIGAAPGFAMAADPAAPGGSVVAPTDLTGGTTAGDAGGPPSGAPPAVTEQTLYTFCAQSGCADGSTPVAGLIMDAAGNLYGTSTYGGSGTGTACVDGCGTVFQLAPTGGGWTQTILYSFCPQGGSCADGQNPEAGLIMDGAGNLYGTTLSGGSHRGGTVFELTPTGGGWTQTVLYSFCAQSNCTDGLSPYAGLIMDAAGNLYGTTDGGGGHAKGTVFKLAPTGGGWTQTILYSFCAQTNCADGQNPQAGLIMDGGGNLYGTTQNGGNTNSSGVVFKLAPAGGGWTQTVLHSFCPQNGCADGSQPVDAGLIMDGAGNLYGTTYSGGNYGSGTVFKLMPGGGGWTETVLYSFCAQSGCTDGGGLRAALVMDGAGNLYGTTRYGGSSGFDGGTVFKLAPTGGGWTQTVLHSFCPQSGCADGANPHAGLIMDGAGNLFGTTEAGGTSCDFGSTGCGVVFEVVAAKPPVCCGDFNGDKKADILWRNTSGALYEWWLNGASQIGGGSAGTVTTDWSVVGRGDFNGDGMTDILWRNTDGTVYLWLMNGTTISSQGSLGVVTSDWQVAGVGDFNGDGKADILWRNTSGQVYIWFMNGLSIASQGAVASATLDWQIAGVGDFNGDGKADILWRNTNGTAYEWLMSGTTISSQGSLGVVTSDWQIAGIGDFNGDGKADILWRNTNGTVYEWLMNGLTIASQGSPGTATTDWQIAGVGDFNGDGKSDILWRNTNGAVYEWLLNGTSQIGAGSPGSATSDWQIQ